MSENSKIEWTESTWNPLTGCSKISPGCANCYAEKLSYRLKAMGNPNYQNGFDLTLHENQLESPLKWKKSRMIFVNSMSDLFHEKVPFDFVLKVFETMIKADHHYFQVLTKRSSVLKSVANKLTWPKHIWLGVSVENENYQYRIENLKTTPAAVKFLSLEPLLGPIPNMNLNGIDWVIVGGESGPKSREIKKEWVLDIKEQCEQYKTPFFFKQWGGINKKKSGRLLEGKIWNEMPTSYYPVS